MSGLPVDDIKDFLDEKCLRYNRPEFIESDPISIPHSFTREEDIELSAFLTAIIAWGQRRTIICNARKLMGLMGNSPHEFIMKAGRPDIESLTGFKHRTFNCHDLHYFLFSLQNIIRNHGGLKNVFQSLYLKNSSIYTTICEFRRLFFSLPHPARTRKHVSNPETGSSAKRINMFLRWMVRNDANGVDFGIWKKIDKKDLQMPLDIHTGNVSRKLGLLARKQNDWKAVAELTGILRTFDPDDPVRYDFALFGLGVFEKF